MNQQEQEKIRFGNMMLRDTTTWWPCTKDENNKLVLSLNTILHFIYMYGTFDMAETCTVGSNSVRYHGDFATFEMSEKYKIPIFKFTEKYKWMEDNQKFFLDGIDKSFHLDWRKDHEHLTDFLKINF